MKPLLLGLSLSIAICSVHAYPASLESQIKAIAEKAPATIGVAAFDMETGGHTALRADERFPMGSVFKFPVALVFLQSVDQGKFKLDETVTIQPSEFSTGYSPIRDAAQGKPTTLSYREIVSAMVKESDNTAVDFLLPKLGGGRAVTRRLGELHIMGLRIDRSEREMADDLSQPGGVERYAADPRDTATPNAAIELLRRFYLKQDGLSYASHELLVRLMTETTTGQKRIKALLPQATVVTHKTGTMPGTANDVGIVTSPDGKHHTLIAIFSKVGAPDRLDDRERAMAEIAQAICQQLWKRLKPA